MAKPRDSADAALHRPVVGREIIEAAVRQDVGALMNLCNGQRDGLFSDTEVVKKVRYFWDGSEEERDKVLVKIFGKEMIEKLSHNGRRTSS